MDTLAFKGEWPMGEKPVIDGFRIRYMDGKMTRFEFSLPHLLWNHNGRVIQNQEEYDRALGAARARFEPLGKLPPPQEWMPARLDFAYNYDLKAAPLINLHATLTIPWMRNKPAHWYDQGLSFSDAKSNLVVGLYDKAAEMHVPGSVLRSEVSFRGREFIKRQLGGRWMDFLFVYGVQREILTAFPAISRFSGRGWHQSIARQPRQIQEEILAGLGLGERAMRSHRNKIRAAAKDVPERFSWEDVLPPDGPPPAVHVERTMRGAMRRHPMDPNQATRFKLSEIAAQHHSMKEHWKSETELAYQPS